MNSIINYDPYIKIAKECANNTINWDEFDNNLLKLISNDNFKIDIFKNETYYLRNQNLKLNNFKKDYIDIIKEESIKYIIKYPKNIRFINSLNNITDKIHMKALIYPSYKNYLIYKGVFNKSLNTVIQLLNLKLPDIFIKDLNLIKKKQIIKENWKSSIITCVLTGSDIDFNKLNFPSINLNNSLPKQKTSEYNKINQYHNNNNNNLYLHNKRKIIDDKIYESKCFIGISETDSEEDIEYKINGLITRFIDSAAKTGIIFNNDLINNNIDSDDYCKKYNIFSIGCKKKTLKLNKYDFIFRCPCLYDDFSQCNRYILFDKESQNKVKTFLLKNSNRIVFKDRINNLYNKLLSIINPNENYRIHPICPNCNFINYNKYAEDNMNLLSVTRHPAENICTNCNVLFCSDCEEIHKDCRYDDDCVNDPYFIFDKTSEYRICKGISKEKLEKLKEILPDTYKYCQACPFCRSVLQRKDGCAHIKCLECDKQFCWHCRCLKHEENSLIKPHICLTGKHYNINYNLTYKFDAPGYENL